ncbi:MAG: long-chain fatty acid--CoA ligase [Betaproteobacteria bacterium]|nr:MAG: long-chain fatty acid--CoA ligase [Betaproteobacteria bacterium]
MRTFRDAIDTHAAAGPDAPCVLAPEPNAVLTYGDLARVGAELGAYLAHEGIPPGSVVSFMLPNGVAAASIFLGAMYAGYIVSPINLLAQDAQLEYTLAHSGTRLIFAAPEFVGRLRALLRRPDNPAPVYPTDPDRVELPRQAPAPLAAVNPQTPAMLMYTSGTTGEPKGVALSHWNMVCAGRAVVEAQAMTSADRVLSSLPLYHINGQCIATVSPVVSGGSIVMPHRFSVSQWWTLVERYRPTWLNMVPTIIAYLLNGADLTSAQVAACRAIRFGRSASAPLPLEQHRAFEARFGISVIEAMGLTETASVAFANPLEPSRRKYGSAGQPLGVEARIVAADGTVLGTGKQGEIELRGDTVMIGYYRNAELTAQAVSPDGWLATGDLGYRDNEGFYFITGRRKELIIKGGENIAPREIDEALLRHPAVLEAAAVGIPDPNYGQDILACIVLKPGACCDEAELRAHCLAQLGRYKTPRLLRFVAALPKGPSGKVQRLRLLEMVQ